MEFNNGLPFSFDFLFDEDGNLGFESNPIHSSDDVDIFIEDVGNELLVTIEKGEVSNVALAPNKWIIKINKKGGPRALKTLVESKNHLGTNVLQRPAELGDDVWVKKGCQIQGNQLHEDDTEGQHFLVQNLVPDQRPAFTDSAIISAIVEPAGRQFAWLGIRENNRFYMAVFDLSESGSVTYVGPNVSGAMVKAESNNNYQICISFNGSLPEDRIDISLGAAAGPSESDREFEGQNGHALTVHGIQVSAGINTGVRSFIDTQNRQEIKALTGPATVLGNRMDAESSDPDTFLSPDYHRFDGQQDIQVTPSPGEWSDNRAISAGVCFAPSGGSGDQHLWGQWGNTDRSWQMGVDGATRKAYIKLSDDGSTVRKHLVLKDPLPQDKKALLAFAFNGYKNDLKVYLNTEEVPLDDLDIVANQELANQSIHDSTRDFTEGRHTDGEAAQADIYHKWFFEGLLDEESLYQMAMDCGLIATAGKQEVVVTPSPSQPTPSVVPNIAIGNPKTEAQLIDILVRKKNVTGIRYVDNQHGDDRLNDGSSNRPYRSIQRLLDALEPGEAGIIRGSSKTGERYHAGGTLPRSGDSKNKRIWICGSPEAPPILDASEHFNATWVQQANGNWRASYNRTRIHSPSVAAASYSHESVWATHQLIFNDRQMKRICQNGIPNLNPGECYFERGGGTFARPHFVHCKLPGGANPNQVHMRIGSNLRSMLDYSPYRWEGMPGGSNETENAVGRNFIGLWGLQFRFGSTVRKRGMTAIRGKGWHVEHCAFLESNACGLSYYGDDHFVYNNHISRNGQYGYREEKTNGCTFQRNYIQENNLHDFPSSFAAGGCKISHAARVKPNETLECYWADNRGVGEWFDIDNGKHATQTPAIRSHHNFYARNMRGGYFNERISIHIEHTDCVVFGTKTNVDGTANQRIGPGIRTQAASQNIHTRIVSVFNEGKGMLYKPDDSRAPANNDTFDHCSFIQNARDANIDQTRAEFQGGDDVKNGKDWITSSIRHTLVSNNDNNVALFHRRQPTPEAKSRNAADFENWSGASNTRVVADPADVVVDFTNERRCYQFKAPFKDWEPRDFTHPLDFDTYWEPANDVR